MSAWHPHSRRWPQKRNQYFWGSGQISAECQACAPAVRRCRQQFRFGKLKVSGFGSGLGLRQGVAAPGDKGSVVAGER